MRSAPRKPASWSERSSRLPACANRLPHRLKRGLPISPDLQRHSTLGNKHRETVNRLRPAPAGSLQQSSRPVRIHQVNHQLLRPEARGVERQLRERILPRKPTAVVLAIRS